MSRTNAEYRSEAPFPEYTLIRRARMRNIRMRVIVPTGEVRVSAPYGTPRWQIDDFVFSRSEWIAAQRDKVATMAPPLEPGLEAARMDAQLWEWLDELLPYWCIQMDLPQPHVTVRIMRSRWGSCRATTNRITLNTELARWGKQQAEYVLVHELCHMYELNHGNGFYALMDMYLPDWRERKARLGPL